MNLYIGSSSSRLQTYKPLTNIVYTDDFVVYHGEIQLTSTNWGFAILLHPSIVTTGNEALKMLTTLLTQNLLLLVLRQIFY